MVDSPMTMVSANSGEERSSNSSIDTKRTSIDIHFRQPLNANVKKKSSSGLLHPPTRLGSIFRTSSTPPASKRLGIRGFNRTAYKTQSTLSLSDRPPRLTLNFEHDDLDLRMPTPEELGWTWASGANPSPTSSILSVINAYADVDSPSSTATNLTHYALASHYSNAGKSNLFNTPASIATSLAPAPAQTPTNITTFGHDNAGATGSPSLSLSRTASSPSCATETSPLSKSQQLPSSSHQSPESPEELGHYPFDAHNIVVSTPGEAVARSRSSSTSSYSTPIFAPEALSVRPLSTVAIAQNLAPRSSATQLSSNSPNFLSAPQSPRQARPSRSLSYLRVNSTLRRHFSKRSNLSPVGASGQFHRPDTVHEVIADTMMRKDSKRPGFFRRLFGAGRENSNLNADSPVSSSITASNSRLSLISSKISGSHLSNNNSKNQSSGVDTEYSQKILAEKDNNEMGVNGHIKLNPRSDSLKAGSELKAIVVPRKPLPRLNLEPASPFKPDLISSGGIGLGLSSVIETEDLTISVEKEGESKAAHGEVKEDESTTANAFVTLPELPELPQLPDLGISDAPIYSAPYSTKSSPLSNKGQQQKFSPLVAEHKRNGSVLPSPNPVLPTPPNSREEESIDYPNATSSADIAALLYAGEFTKVPADEYAQWLGSDSNDRQSVRALFMKQFDLTGKSILASLRMICDKLYMKGESQQLNRIIEAFSQAWVDKNPQHGFYDSNVVYTITYALILLNTDIYAADHSVQKKMSKGTFVHNTMDTIRSHIRSEKQAEVAAEVLRSSNGSQSPTEATHYSTGQSNLSVKRGSLSVLSSTTSVYSLDTTALVNDQSVKAMTKEWEFHLETILKIFYSSISKEALKLQMVATTPSPISPSLFNPSNLSPSFSSTPSLRSSAVASTSSASIFGRMSSKLRHGRSYENHSRLVNLDRRADNFRRDSLNSTFSFESNYSSSMGRHAVGFAGLLWNSMIKEEGQTYDNDEDFGDFSRIEAELAKEVELELHGAPWAKEGLLKYRPYVDPSSGKKSKKREWAQVFVVVQRGQVKIFKFDLNSKSKPPRSGTSGGVVGGGNWMDNAELIDGFHLCHTMAQELPPPKKARGYTAMWSLTLPQRGLLVFQAGTSEIAQEYVYTCNYWAGRLSKEPFEEPVSSMEYGWGSALDENSSMDSTPDRYARPASAASLRGTRPLGNKPGDRLDIRDWRPTGHSLVVSDLNEEKQLESMKAYVSSAEQRFSEHNGLRARLLHAYTPNTPNWTKVHQNWERKSQYLLQQLIRFKVYIDNLERGIKDKRVKWEQIQEKENEASQKRSVTTTASSVNESTVCEKDNDVSSFKTAEAVTPTDTAFPVAS